MFINAQEMCAEMRFIMDKTETYTVERTFMDEFSPESGVERMIRVHMEPREDVQTVQCEDETVIRA